MHNIQAASDQTGRDDHVSLSKGAQALQRVLAQPTKEVLAMQKPLKHLLVVEDDLDLASLEANFLATHGFTVITVHNGEDAIAFLQGSLPDMVVLDIELAGSLDGWQVLHFLRHHANIPVLLTTSAIVGVRKQLRDHAESRATLDHLAKPYTMPSLLKQVQRMLMVAPNS
jgi:DNA-binding response OmpR family regulator